MSQYNRNRGQCILIFMFSLLFSGPNQAWINAGIGDGRGNTHYHEDNIRVYNPGGYYDRGRYYNPGLNIIVPNIIINTAPAPRYYTPACEEVEVCNRYRECWLERYCD